MTNNKLNIGTIGGSLGGLFAGIALQKQGHTVNIFERTGEQLSDRGAGIVLQYELIDFLKEYNIASLDEISVPIHQRRYIDKEGNDTYLDSSTQHMTAWGTIYHRLMNHFSATNYHYGCKLKSMHQNDNSVTVEFENGKQETVDLLIGADGIHSVVRNILFPEVLPSYAGYVGWRGIVQEDELAPEILKEFIDRFTFYTMPNSHILCYLIPGDNDEITPGKRRLNWVWYWNVKAGDAVKELLTDVNEIYRSGFVAEGMVKPPFIETQRAIANEVMPPIFKALIAATKQPFIQPINDLSVSRMYVNRVALLGDAAFTPRPHTAASTAKAVANAVSLAEHLNSYDDVEKALAMWEKPQLQMGNQLRQKGMMLGNQSQFGISNLNV